MMPSGAASSLFSPVSIRCVAMSASWPDARAAPRPSATNSSGAVRISRRAYGRSLAGVKKPAVGFLPWGSHRGDDGEVQESVTSLVGALLWTVTTLWRPLNARRRRFTVRELGADLATENRAFALYVVARLVAPLFPQSDAT